MGSGRVTVVGSFAVGLTLRADRMPVAGETVLARDFDQGPGGKGSNQAVQAARLGADVEFMGCIGTDSLAEIATDLFAREGVGTGFLFRTEETTTGVGFILLDGTGENRILLDPGANEHFSPRHVQASLARIEDSDIVITQLEIPLETAVRALELASSRHIQTILNPAPARPLPPEILGRVELLTPNQVEARVLCGRPPGDPASDVHVCRELIARGARRIVMTRGSQGALVVTSEGEMVVPAHVVDPVDTTGAGDAFNGSLATALAQGLPLEESVARAVAAGAIACLELGVIPSLPTSERLDGALAQDRLRTESP